MNWRYHALGALAVTGLLSSFHGVTTLLADESPPAAQISTAICYRASGSDADAVTAAIKRLKWAMADRRQADQRLAEAERLYMQLVWEVDHEQ